MSFTEDDSELIAGDPLDGVIASKNKYIGVPDGYVIEPTDRPYGTRRPPRTPKFEEGDDLIPASFSPAVVAQIQEDLARAGLYGKKASYRKGVWDEKTRKAYRGLLAYGNRAGIGDPEVALRRWIATGEQLGEVDEGRERAPFVAQVTNPGDLQTAADELAPKTIARKVRPEEMAQITREYQSQEVAAQRASYGAAESGGVVAAPESFTSFMKAKLMELDPKGATEVKAGEIAQALFSLFTEPERLSE